MYGCAYLRRKPARYSEERIGNSNGRLECVFGVVFFDSGEMTFLKENAMYFVGNSSKTSLHVYCLLTPRYAPLKDLGGGWTLIQNFRRSLSVGGCGDLRYDGGLGFAENGVLDSPSVQALAGTATEVLLLSTDGADTVEDDASWLRSTAAIRPLQNGVGT